MAFIPVIFFQHCIEFCSLSIVIRLLLIVDVLQYDSGMCFLNATFFIFMQAMYYKVLFLFHTFHAALEYPIFRGYGHLRELRIR